jgi:hypothetical protein
MAAGPGLRCIMPASIRKSTSIQAQRIQSCRSPNPSGLTKPPSINGINMKHSQHKNLIQLFHKAVDQRPQALPSLPDEDVPASTRPVERLGPIQWAETAGPTRLRARQNRQNAPRGQGTIALKITAARGAGQASTMGKLPACARGSRLHGARARCGPSAERDRWASRSPCSSRR